MGTEYEFYEESDVLERADKLCELVDEQSQQIAELRATLDRYADYA